MSGWDGPTIFGAAVGSTGTGLALLEHLWQRQRWKQERAARTEEALTRIAVSIALVFPPLGVKPGTELLVVSARNDSRHDVRITQVDLTVISDSMPSKWQIGPIWPNGSAHVVPPNTIAIPGVLAPHEEGHATLVGADSERRYFRHVQKMKARVRTADGDFESEPIDATDLPILRIMELPYPARARE